MKTIIALYSICLLFFVSPMAQAQEKPTKEDALKWLYNEGKFDTIIEEYTADAQLLDVPSLYYLAFANMEKKNFATSLEFIDMALKKDDTLSDSYRIKGDILKSLQRYGEAIIAYRKAKELDPKDFDNAFALGQAYGQMGDYKNGILVFKEALVNLEPETESYMVSFYNLGLLESFSGNYKAAIPYFDYLLQMNPTDYFTQSKLIQAYYQLGDYKAVEPLKKGLYKAHADSLLNDTDMEDMFCIEQFEVKGNKVLAFERYEDGPSTNIYNKHCFYVLKTDGDLRFRVQTEYSPFSKSDDMLYFLCVTFSEKRRANSGITFEKNYDYRAVKPKAIKYIKQILKNQK